MPHVLGPESSVHYEILNKSIESWSEVGKSVVGRPDTFTTSETTLATAVRAFAQATGRDPQAQPLADQFRYLRQGKEPAWLHAVIARAGGMVAVTSSDQPLETDDVVLLSFYIC